MRNGRRPVWLELRQWEREKERQGQAGRGWEHEGVRGVEGGRVRGGSCEGAVAHTASASSFPFEWDEMYRDWGFFECVKI